MRMAKAPKEHVDRLERDTPNFRLAKDYGLIEIYKHNITFYFEKN